MRKTETGAVGELRSFLGGVRYGGGELARRFRAVGAGLCRVSPAIRTPDFDETETRDLLRLFDLYDAHFFGGRLRAALGGREIRFDYSRRMTSSGGKTLRWRDGRGRRGGDRFAIRISIHLLFRNFSGVGHREVRVGGLPCGSRLEALQRIFEHELVHLAEMLAWDDSNCSAPRFAGIVRRLFGHTETRHGLVTAVEEAAVRHGVGVGSRVSFPYRGRRLEGFVNRITKRATVLVEDPRGRPYSDGRCYAKYYVPLSALARVEEGESEGGK